MKEEMTVNGVEKMENIIVHNATENNLKNITVQIPIGKFTCVTGPSGCGKSSLVYDTIFAESQRNFLESLSGNLYGQKIMDKPKVDSIENLHPALDISQKYYNVNPRSTVGTITDISYYVRTLFAFIVSHSIGKNLDMNYFSPNNPSSCCNKCNGLGEEYVVSEQAVFPDKNKSLESGGILYYKGSKQSQEYKLLEAICDKFNICIKKKVKDLTDTELYQLLYRTQPVDFLLKFKTPKGRYKQKTISQKGAIVELNEKLEHIDVPSTFVSISKYLRKVKCSKCNGLRLSPEVLNYKICNYNIGETENLSLTNLTKWVDNVRTKYQIEYYYDEINQLLNNIESRITKLIELSLGYLTLARSIPSLSGGEVQRVRIAAQLSCSLSGLVYILDEPCKGLHYKNIESIISAVHKLTGNGNTVVAIEHNKKFLSTADFSIYMGPEGGPNGGYIIDQFNGGINHTFSLKYKESIPTKIFLSIKGIAHHNLKGLNIHFPINRITCITGVSGSGKSSLADVIEACYDHGSNNYCSSYTANSSIKRVVRVDQKPIGKTPRSTVVSYLGIYDAIRNLFANTKESNKLGFSSSDFSMNVAGGRCECCQGTGRKKYELSYLPETYVICPDCKGKRFHSDILSVKYKGKNINDILNESIHNLLPIFDDTEDIFTILQCMEDIGLGYISLGQMSMNLSGGEAQRIKLAKNLGDNSNSHSLYILDEPTSGLGDHDIKLLEDIIQKLATNNTIVIIEHNIEFITRISDYLIDLGSISGDDGGRTIIEGDPKTVMYSNESSWYDLIATL